MNGDSNTVDIPGISSAADDRTSHLASASPGESSDTYEPNSRLKVIDLDGLCVESSPKKDTSNTVAFNH